MTVHFIGAGPGAGDLITVRAQRLLQRCQTCLYAGSLVEDALSHSGAPASQQIDTSSLTLDAIIGHMVTAHNKGHDIARLHSGDTSLYGAIHEQIQELATRNIPYDITPGVTSFAATAACLATSLTLPHHSQSVVLTRYPGKASPIPETESLIHFARSQCTLIIHLSIRQLKAICRELAPLYGDDCPTVVAYRVSWPQQKIIRATLKTIVDAVKPYKLTRHALIIVSPVLDTTPTHRSGLYDPHHQHIKRPRKLPL
ncbi:MAG: precorrin-4 C(11)-methyltransferase [Alphaproteobacteria bacterium GM202ARS2]|nr:precorrin-4 C(11)-methyltransferase [Alphaproteobacteria bacterium GM202ARS2]